MMKNWAKTSVDQLPKKMNSSPLSQQRVWKAMAVHEQFARQNFKRHRTCRGAHPQSWKWDGHFTVVCSAHCKAWSCSWKSIALVRDYSYLLDNPILYSKIVSNNLQINVKNKITLTRAKPQKQSGPVFVHHPVERFRQCWRCVCQVVEWVRSISI